MEPEIVNTPFRNIKPPTGPESGSDHAQATSVDRTNTADESHSSIHVASKSANSTPALPYDPAFDYLVEAATEEQEGLFPQGEVSLIAGPSGAGKTTLLLQFNSGDKSIERVPEERQAVINARCKVFMFDNSHMTRTEDWAASLIVGRHRLIEIAERTDGPLFVTIKKCKVQGHVSQPRFVELGGGGWRPKEPEMPKAKAEVQHQSKKLKRRQQQTKIEFPEQIRSDESCGAVDQTEQIMSEIETQNMQREWLKELEDRHHPVASKSTH